MSESSSVSGAVTSTVQGRRMGRQPERPHGALTMLAKLTDLVKISAMPPIPEAAGFGVNGIKSWGMMGNDQYGDCTCFPAGTLVRMADGTSKPIETVRLLDRVVTAERRESYVTALMVKPVDGHLLRIQAWGHKHLRLTDEHPVMTRRGYVAAKDLTGDDWMALPTWRPETCDSIAPRDYFALQPANIRHTAAKLPEQIYLTSALGRIVGLYMAEGSTSQTIVRWTFGKHEITTLAPELVELLAVELGINARLTQRPNGTADVTVCGKRWRLLFDLLCGKGCEHKALHADLWRGEDDFLRAVLTGWLAGDGYMRPGEHIGTTVSHALSQDMFGIAQVLGYRPTVRGRDPGRGKRYVWHVVMRDRRDDDGGSVSGAHMMTSRSDTDGDTLLLVRAETGSIGDGKSFTEGAVTWRRVRCIEIEPFVGFVFNLSVAGDESYVAEGIGVHNCAAVGHQILQLTSWSERAPVVMSTIQALKLYKQVNPDWHLNDPNTDTGAVMSDVLAYWYQFGVDLGLPKLDFLSGYGTLRTGADAKLDMQRAIAWTSGAQISLALPNSALSNTRLWDALPDDGGIAGGHQVYAIYYNKTGVWIISWGMKIMMTWAFLTKYMQAGQAPLSMDAFRANGVNPQQIDQTTLASTMANFQPGLGN